MKIGIDLDGVLADSIRQVIKFHNEKYGTTTRYEDVHSYELWEVWKCTREEAIKRTQAFNRTSYFPSIKPIRDAIRKIPLLTQRYDSCVITSRSTEIKDETLRWLNQYFPNRFYNVHFTNEWAINPDTKTTKVAICKENEIEILIDDAPANIRECAVVCEQVILFDQPWNQGDGFPYNVARAKNWREVLKILK